MAAVRAKRWEGNAASRLSIHAGGRDFRTESRLQTQGFGLASGAHFGWLAPPSAAGLHGARFACRRCPQTETPWRRPRRSTWGSTWPLPDLELRHGSRRGPCTPVCNEETLSTPSPPCSNRTRDYMARIGMLVKNYFHVLFLSVFLTLLLSFLHLLQCCQVKEKHLRDIVWGLTEVFAFPEIEARNHSPISSWPALGRPPMWRADISRSSPFVSISKAACC
jgi:hypothetical protein